MGTGTMTDWIILGVIVFFAYQLGYSYGKSVGRRSAPNQANKKLQVENVVLKEKLDIAEKAILGYQNESHNQKEYVAYLAKRLSDNKITFENLDFRE